MSQKQKPRIKKTASPSSPGSGLPWGIIAAVIGLLLLTGLVIFAAYEASQPPRPIEGVSSFGNLARDHVSGIVPYAQTPPVGGPHNPVWQNCGVYTQPLQAENAVHALEHGAVWITYQPELAASEIQKLQSLTRQSGFRLLSPYPGLAHRVVVSAWGYQLQVEKADDPRLSQFIEKYERNPNGPEPSAPCTGGTGTPQ